MIIGKNVYKRRNKAAALGFLAGSEQTVIHEAIISVGLVGGKIIVNGDIDESNRSKQYFEGFIIIQGHGIVFIAYQP